MSPEEGPSQEELDKKLRKELLALVKLKKVYKKGKFDKEEVKERKDEIWNRIKNIKKDKNQLYEKEKSRLKKKLGELEKERKERKIDDFGYLKKRKAIENSLDRIEDEITLMTFDIGEYMKKREKKKKEEFKKPVDERPGKPDYYLFPLLLWIIVAISGIITGIILAGVFLLGFYIAGSSFFMYRGSLLISMILRLIITVILALIVAGILMFSALIAGVYPKRITYKKSLIAVIAEAVTIIGLSTIFSVGLGLFGFTLYLPDIPYYLLYLVSLGIYLGIGSWIIRSIFYTTWKRAAITWIIKTVAIFVLYLLVMLALGARINLF